MLTTRAREDYVKAIYQLGGGRPVAAANLARYLGVSRAAVTKFRRVLTAGRLVERAQQRTDHIRLSHRGEALAIAMLRRHRIVETFLHRTLGVSLDALHEQAEAIEHVISDDLAKRLERFLGRPEFDPHGHPISGAARRLPRYAALSDAAKGSNIRIVAIPDRDAAVVRKLVSEHVVPGLRARVIDQSRRETTLRSAKGLHSVSGAVAPFIQVRIERRSRR